MKQKAPALTTVASLLPPINQVDTRTVTAQQLSAQNTQSIKTNPKTLYSNNEINTRANNSLTKHNRSKSTSLFSSVVILYAA
ncbi:hypothetical protein [Bacillus sp. C1]